MTVSVVGYEIVERFGAWNFGLESLDIEVNRIKIRTWVMQDRGAPNNGCLAPGFAEMTIGFKTTQADRALDRRLLETKKFE